MVQLGRKQETESAAHKAARQAPVRKKAQWQLERDAKRLGVDDMTLLTSLTNQAINSNLKLRFDGDEIYSYIGHVLISVNPFRQLPLYGKDVLDSYMGRSRLEMPPHVFAIAESAYKQMIGYNQNQCVIISGESGAGKTEAAKKIMSYIATVSAGSSSSSIQHVKDMILATNPLLESFGNAQTLRNSNSSRFGKYLEILFDTQGAPVGAKITNYLLEKGRVVHQVAGERNFHIFYQLCQGAEDEWRNEFGLGAPEHYTYTAMSNTFTIQGVDDVEDYQQVMHAMQIIGLNRDEIREIHRVICAILWLGNIMFEEAQNGEDAVVSDYDPLNSAAFILQVAPEALTKAITTRYVETQRGMRKGSAYEVPLNVSQAGAVRDALSKALYSKLFDWIVQRLNVALQQVATAHLNIGILDIYGFEIFENNSFEQLSINYVNEKLQQIFIELTLKAEQEDYVREGIAWTPIDYFNNKIVCDLIEEKRPPGVFSLLNDACATAHADPEAADKAFAQRLGGMQNAHLEPRGASFLIKHYAGDVYYDISGMTDKNKDQLSKDLLNLVSGSSSNFLTSLFPEKVDQNSKKRPPTASDLMKSSAVALVHALMQCNPHYIRCIKPNERKAARDYDDSLCAHQIKYLGLLENIRVRRAGFAARNPFEQFIERFFLLSRQTCYAGELIWNGDAKTGCVAILKDSCIDKSEWQLGKSKVFIKSPETLFALETLRDRYWQIMAIRIQRAWRRYQQYRGECASLIQRAWAEYRGLSVPVHMRDLGHDLLGGRKERRRFSLIAYRKFMGDYMNLAEPSGAIIREAAQLPSQELIIFSSPCEILHTRLLRSSKATPRIIIMTDSSIYLVVTKIENNIAVQRQDRKIPLSMISGMTMSNLQDNWLMIHVNDADDLAVNVDFKTELATYISFQTKKKARMDIAPGGQLILNDRKGKKKGTINIVKNEQAGQHTTLKKNTVQVASGADPSRRTNKKPKRKPRPKKLVNPNSKIGNRAARPPPATNRTPVKSNQAHSTPTQHSSTPAPPPPQTNGAVQPSNKYKVLYDFEKREETEMTITIDEVVTILNKENPNGWWLATNSSGEKGWVPNSYLEEVKQPMAAPPLPPKAAAPASTPVAVPRPAVGTTSQTTPTAKPRPAESHGSTPGIASATIGNMNAVAVFPGMGKPPVLRQTSTDSAGSSRSSENRPPSNSGSKGSVQPPMMPPRPVGNQQSLSASALNSRTSLHSTGSAQNSVTKSTNSQDWRSELNAALDGKGGGRVGKLANTISESGVNLGAPVPPPRPVGMDAGGAPARNVTKPSAPPKPSGPKPTIPSKPANLSGNPGRSVVRPPQAPPRPR